MGPHDEPFDQPEAGAFTFTGRSFCLTGNFLSGPRQTHEASIVRRGGIVADWIADKTDFLIVGALGSAQYKRGSYGTKIRDALDLRWQSGSAIRIFDETTWARLLEQTWPADVPA